MRSLELVPTVPFELMGVESPSPECLEAITGQVVKVEGIVSGDVLTPLGEAPRDWYELPQSPTAQEFAGLSWTPNLRRVVSPEEVLGWLREVTIDGHHRPAILVDLLKPKFNPDGLRFSASTVLVEGLTVVGVHRVINRLW